VITRCEVRARSATTRPTPTTAESRLTPVYHPEGPTFLELMRQALASTERGYDLLAPKFDRTPFRTPDHVLEAMIQAIGPERL